MGSDTHTLIDAEFDLDEGGLAAERDPGGAAAILGDHDIRLLLRENRVALARGATTAVAAEGDGAGYDVNLTCVVHSHPQCRFQWSRLLVDLTPTPGARIADMAPREVTDDRPVQLQTTIGLGLKFNVVTNVLGAELTPEYSRSRTVYFPRIMASGNGFTRGYWDFLALDDSYLHANRELRLLVAAPKAAAINARFQLRARVKLAGVAGLIPMLARTGGIDTVHRLDD